jgi:hypothetical protein
VRLILALLLSSSVFAQVKSEAFLIQINDRSVSVVSPDKANVVFAVLVENRSLSDQVARFTVGGKTIKHISVKSGRSETVEIENKTGAKVVFVPISPAFQDVVLTFGKKAYDIPGKD